MRMFRSRNPVARAGLWCVIGGVLLAVGAAAPIGAQPGTPSAGVPGPALLLHIQGPIGPATADYLARGIEKAVARRAPVVVLQLDTPGGLDSSTRLIIQEILAAPVPVLAWVAPGGARAASAGAYILYASHLAAMAPGTNLGAATPVQIGGLPGSGPPAPAQEPAAGAPNGAASAPRDVVAPAAGAMTRKVVNDSAAYLRALAQMRGRNAGWADRAVREGASLSASEALQDRVIDFMAPELASLLEQAHGRTVLMGDGARRAVQSRGLQVVAFEVDWRNRLLGVITEPTVAYLLLLLGIYGIYFELASPGFGVPGVAGAIALLLGMFALQMLPVSYAGVALIVLGFAMLVAEALLPSFGALGVGGAIAFVIGSVMLIDTDTPGFGIPIGLIASVAVLNAVFVLFVVRMALQSSRRPPVSGSEELPGSRGEVLEVTDQGAWARVHSERWRVVADAPLQAGARVRVTGRDGLVLRVEPETPAGPTTVQASPAPGHPNEHGRNT